MNHQLPPLIPVPTALCDQAAAELLELLRDIADAIETQYAAQLLRHYHRPDPRQQQLWDDREPPF